MTLYVQWFKKESHEEFFLIHLFSTIISSHVCHPHHSYHLSHRHFPASKLVFFSQIIPCLPSTDIWHCRNIGKKSNLRRSSSAITKAYCTSRIICTKLNGRWTFHGRLFAALQCMIFGWKSTSACQGYCDSIDGAILLSKVVFNNLRANVKNDITLICAKFGADVVNTSKFTSRKTKWPRFLALFVCQ